MRHGGGSGVARYAQPRWKPRRRDDTSAPRVQEEPDVGYEIGKLVRETTGLNDERKLTSEDRITPIDKWLGFDKYMLNGRSEEDDPFVDPSVDENYVTIVLDKPLGIEFVENTEEQGGGVVVGEVRPGYSAFGCDQIREGYQLIVADEKPVHGLSFDDAIDPIAAKQGAIKLTFFVGEADHFYGKYRPTEEWLASFFERLRAGEMDDVQ